MIDEKEQEGQVLTGQELEAMTDEQFAQVVEKVVVYARVAPEHKMRIVKAWKQERRSCRYDGRRRQRCASPQNE